MNAGKFRKGLASEPKLFSAEKIEKYLRHHLFIENR
jgi:hypothetical protein